MLRKIFLYTILALTLLLLPQNLKAVELITNGGFETGDFTGWTTVGVPFNASPFYRPWAVSMSGAGGGYAPVPTATSVQQGTYNAWNGIVSGGTGQEWYLYQDITIPTGFNVRMTWNDRVQMNLTGFCTTDCGTATFTVQILTTSNVLRQTLYVVTAVPGQNINTGYQNHIANLTAYAGQTIRVRFRTTSSQPYKDPAQAEIDAVSVQTLQPTAANVPVGGRVLTSTGAGISRATVTLTDSRGNARSLTTGSFGYYQFDDVPAGETYMLTVNSKRFYFENNPRVVNVQESLADVDFVANP